MVLWFGTSCSAVFSPGLDGFVRSWGGGLVAGVARYGSYLEVVWRLQAPSGAMMYIILSWEGSGRPKSRSPFVGELCAVD